MLIFFLAISAKNSLLLCSTEESGYCFTLACGTATTATCGQYAYRCSGNGNVRCSSAPLIDRKIDPTDNICT